MDQTMNNLTQLIKETQSHFETALSSTKTIEQLEEYRIQFLGRKGSITSLMTIFKDLSIEEKRTQGPLLQSLKTDIETRLEAKKQQLLLEAQEAAIAKQKYFDVTASKPESLKGTLHIYTQIIEQIEDIFISMGYSIADGPEVETEYYNFQALNIPADHPARDMQDTFWLTLPNKLMRTHTSNVQARCMEKGNLPLAIIAPGRVYRNEATDASHDFMFTQVEGLLIDKNISMANLLATTKTFLAALLENPDITIRVRPGFFPFVEPGVEIDASCPFCTHGCSTCKKTGWIELVGAGLVHPNVLECSGIDPEKYSGFAFGFGIERLAMIKHRINDIRLFHSGPIPFLNQF